MSNRGEFYCLNTDHQHGTREEEIECSAEYQIDRLQEELQRALEPWTVYVFVDESSTGGNPFASYECKTVDVGVADRHLMVECDEVQALRDRAAKLRAVVDAAHTYENRASIDTLSDLRKALDALEAKP